MHSDLWSRVERELQPDGSLRDIYVDADSAVWARFLAAAADSPYAPRLLLAQEPSSRWVWSYSEAAALKEAQDLLLQLDAGGIGLNCHFFNEEDIELDIDPSQVEGPTKLEALLDFLRWLARTTGREASLTHENRPKHVILSVDAGGSVRAG